jgi:hypothetical protein
VGGTVSWNGGSGAWSDPTKWSTLQVPVAGDSVTIGVADSIVTLDVAGAAAALTLTAGTLDLLQQLTATGTVSLAGGVLDLAGTLSGGTLSLGPGGGLVGQGGLLAGVFLPATLLDFGALTIDAATASLDANATLAPNGTLTLAAGDYTGDRFLLDPLRLSPAGDTTELDAAIGASVTLGSGTTVSLSGDAAPGKTQPLQPAYGESVALGGGTFVNDGLVSSDFSNAPSSGGLAITAAAFTNNGTMAFVPLLALESDSFPTGYDKFGGVTSSELSWNEGFAPTLDIASAQFDNTGSLTMTGGTIAVQGAQFANSGTIDAQATTEQQIQSGDPLTTVVPQTLPGVVQFAADVSSFSNTGTISASMIAFENSVSLSSLGKIGGALDFSGTLDLGGGVLDASAYGTVTLAGLVENGTVAAGTGTLVLDGATLDNVDVTPGGSIESTGPITLIDPPAATQSVTLDGTTTELAFTAGTSVGTLLVTAATAGATATLAELGTGTLTLGGGFSLDVTAGTVDVTGGGSIVDDGTIIADAAHVTIAPTLDGTGTITIEGGAQVTLDALAATANLTVVYGAGNGLLVMPGTGAGVTLAGLQPGDLINFTSLSGTAGSTFAEPGATIDSGTLDVTAASAETAHVPVSDAAAGLTFNVGVADGGGTLVTASCFRRGTRIATPRGDVPVEQLRIGDPVVIAGGGVGPVKWIGRRCYPAAQVAAHRELRPVRIAAGALAPGVPARPLEVSPEHALLVEGALIPAGALVNGLTITRVEPAGDVMYLHLEMARHALVLAEGAAAETFVPLAGRALFDNAAEYTALYGAGPEQRSADLPRAEGGAAVERARAILLRRAGAAMRRRVTGRLRGHVERVANGMIEGWAYDDADPQQPLALEICVGGVAQGVVLANRYRIDLDHHGLPACGFRAPAPQDAAVEIRRAGSNAALPLGPQARAA